MDEEGWDLMSNNHEDLRNQYIPFDFKINVGVESVPVHQKTLTTHSEYFREILAHDTKEKQQGFVDIKVVSPAGVRECVEFMYSGKVNVEAETVEDILQAADMMELANLNDICAKFLYQKLTFGNYVSTLNLATKYELSELEEYVRKIHENNFQIGITSLILLPKNDFVVFLKNNFFGNEVAWDWIINWIKHNLEERKEFVFNLVKLLKWTEFPSTILLRRLWKESLVRKSPHCREFLFEKLFLNLGAFKSNLNIGNYVILKTLCHENKHVIQEIKDLVSKFLKPNFLQLSKQTDFKYLLNEKEFISLFTDAASRGIVAEKWRWIAMISWIRSKQNRKKYLSSLMKTIEFDRLPRSFLKIDVRNEPLMQECSAFFISALSQLTIRKKSASIAVLYPNGQIKTWNSLSKSWNILVEKTDMVQNAEIFHFNKKLCLIDGIKLFYLQDNKWIERQQMKCAVAGPKKITTVGDFFYVICNEKMMTKYNSLTDSWDEVDLPKGFGRVTCAAAFDACVYVCGEKMFKINVAKNQMYNTKLRKIYFSTAALVDGESYVYENEKVKKFDFDSGVLSTLKDIPDSGFRFSFPSRSSSSSQPAKAHSLLNLNGRLALAIDSKIYVHDDICDQWNFLVDIPKLRVVIKDKEENVDAISVCVYEL